MPCFGRLERADAPQSIIEASELIDSPLLRLLGNRPGIVYGNEITFRVAALVSQRLCAESNDLFELLLVQRVLTASSDASL